MVGAAHRITIGRRCTRKKLHNRASSSSLATASRAFHEVRSFALRTICAPRIPLIGLSAEHRASIGFGCFLRFLKPRGNECPGAQEMIEPVNAEEFITQPERRKPEQFEYVKLRINAGVARMTLNRPEHNLLNEAMLREIADGVIHAGERDDVKLIVLDSPCKVFCGGIDIGEYTSQRVFQMLHAFHTAFAGMLELGKPAVCLVNGQDIRVGPELAAFGDLVIATPKARFPQPEISIGIFPPLPSTILPLLLRPKIALH